MGTTDNFDTPNLTVTVGAADTVPVISNSTSRGATARIDQLLRGGGLTITSIADTTNHTYTAAEVVSGVIVRDPNGGNKTDTLPTAALLVGGLTRPAVGDVVKVLITNGADTAETLTLAAGSGGTFDNNQTSASRVVAQNSSKFVFIRLTNVTSGSEAYMVVA